MSRGPAGAFLLTALQMLCGTYALMVIFARAFAVISRGYLRSSIWVLAPLLVAISIGLNSSLRVFGVIAAGSMIVFLAAVYSEKRIAEVATGAASSLGALGLMVLVIVDSGQGVTRAALIVSGLVVAGAVTHGMTLGHWYLNQPRLPITPLRIQTDILLVALLVFVSAGVAARSSLAGAEVASAVLRFEGNTLWTLWLALMVVTGVLGLMIRSTVKIKSNQSATGLYYIAIITALSGQFLINLALLA